MKAMRLVRLLLLLVHSFNHRIRLDSLLIYIRCMSRKNIINLAMQMRCKVFYAILRELWSFLIESKEMFYVLKE